MSCCLPSPCVCEFCFCPRLKYLFSCSPLTCSLLPLLYIPPPPIFLLLLTRTIFLVLMFLLVCLACVLDVFIFLFMLIYLPCSALFCSSSSSFFRILSFSFWFSLFPLSSSSFPSSYFPLHLSSPFISSSYLPFFVLSLLPHPFSFSSASSPLFLLSLTFLSSYDIFYSSIFLLIFPFLFFLFLTFLSRKLSLPSLSVFYILFL